MIPGISRANRRVTRRVVSVRSALASAKRRWSCSLRSKARMTRMPARVSRITRLIRSIFTCMARNRGTAGMATRAMSPAMTGRITASDRERRAFTRIAMKSPPIPMIGAMAIMVRARSTTICTCCTSLVARVISEWVPKRFSSIWEKLSTRRNSAERRSRPEAMELRAARRTLMIAASPVSRVTPSITAPTTMM